MSTDNQRLNENLKSQRSREVQPLIVGTPSIGNVIADVLKSKSLQKGDDNPLISIGAASSHGKTDTAAQVGSLKAQVEEDEQKAPSFADLIRAMAGIDFGFDSSVIENESKGSVELIPKDFINKKISIKIEVSDLMENSKMSSTLDTFLDAKGMLSFSGDSGLEDTTSPLERANVIIFSVIVDAMKDFYNELNGGN